jgi:hypothetical protein
MSDAPAVDADDAALADPAAAVVQSRAELEANLTEYQEQLDQVRRVCGVCS